MKIALIADIHANLVSFDAVLADIERANAEQLICLGDVAATGPQPRETLARLRTLGCPVIMGNADAWLLSPQPPDDTGSEARMIFEVSSWCAEQLLPEDLEYIRAFHTTLEVPLGERGALLCFHGSPRSYDEIMVATTPEEQLERMLGGAHAEVMAGGHTHAPMLRRYKDVLLVNPGSVGLPYEVAAQSNHVRNPPWAEYALLTASGDGLNIEFRRVPVDERAVVNALRASGVPHAEWLAQDWG
jgi:putative phosphoesterase